MADGILPVIQRKNPEKEFEILKQIGSGTYGEVYKAREVKRGELVALKIIKIEPGEDFNIIQQEIAILADCKNANIVGYHGSYLRRDRLWIAMEYCGGGSLQDIYHVTGAGLNELQIAFVCRETLAGLAYLHERNKMHRDIKGANILLTDNGDVKLADFGIAAQLTQTMLMKRKSFIGTPYWMAPEVAAVERKGGYNQQCDIWAVGITAIELAETQPPMFDLHPMRALYLMTKKNFKAPGLQHKNKWSDNFHDFLRFALTKDPKRRPAAYDLLKHDFVNRPALCSPLMISLIKVLEAPSPKARPSVSEGEDDEDKDVAENTNFRRVPSAKNQSKIDRQQSDADMRACFDLPAPAKSEPTNEPMPAWMQAAASENHHPGIHRISSVPMLEDPEYQDPEAQLPQVPTTLPSSSAPAAAAARQAPPPTPPLRTTGPGAPPVPPRQASRVVKPVERPSSPVYSNVDKQPPVPPRQRQQPTAAPPVVPPRATHNGPATKVARKRAEQRKAYFSKIFNGCPLHLNCAAAWSHPLSSAQYVLLGADEGLFSLLVTDNPDPVMEQVSSRPCHWLRVVENALVWLSGHSRIIYMTNLVFLFQSDAARASLSHRNKQHTQKIQDSRGCIKCCISRNPFTDQRYLIAAVPKGLLLMQWYQPKHAFMHVMICECEVPSPIDFIEGFVREDEEYPIVCFGAREGPSNSVIFETMNLTSQSSWYCEQPEAKQLPVLCIQQLEKDTIFVGLDRYAVFVDRDGKMKPSSLQASQIVFERKSEQMVYLSNCVLSFHKHGMQGKSLVTQQVTAEVADGSKIFHLLGSHGTIIIETCPVDDPTAASNIYILVSEESPPS